MEGVKKFDMGNELQGFYTSVINSMPPLLFAVILVLILCILVSIGKCLTKMCPKINEKAKKLYKKMFWNIPI